MFVKWHDLRHPRDMGQQEVEDFLAMSANERRVAAATHNQALSALLFLYREVLDMELPWLDGVQRPRTPQAHSLSFDGGRGGGSAIGVAGRYGLAGPSAVRHRHAADGRLRLRVKDLDLDRGVVVVRQAKGDKDQVVMLPRGLAAELHQQVCAARALWEQDRQVQCGGVDIPHALETKYPGMGRRWGWFWVFPASSLSVDPRTGVWQRHHFYEERLQRALKKAVAQLGICKPVSVHTLRHSFATHLAQSSIDILTVQELLGHSDVSTTMIYTHVLKVAGGGTTSPLDTWH